MVLCSEKSSVYKAYYRGPGLFVQGFANFPQRENDLNAPRIGLGVKFHAEQNGTFQMIFI